MRHRGPDAQDIWHNEQNYIAGFARLAIRDLSVNGSQPMLSQCGNFCINFNGEIYNTAALKNLLKQYHSQFKSTSDTEVLLYALMHLGIKETLQAADGIFAFAFYDLNANSLVLARDRVGVKPLYAGICDDGVVYSSQYDHIMNHPYFSSETIDSAAIGSYLSLGYIPENLGALHNTKLLLHGCYYIVKDYKIEQHQYYEYPSITNQSGEKLLDQSICDSVKSQLVSSDVPVGTFMSGGVDSTLITYFANKQTKINSFTIGVGKSSMDESVNAQTFADIFKTEHHCNFFAQNDLLTLIDENTKAFTEPFADFSSLPVLMLSKYARKKVTVALSGDGGDELFWGYPRHITAVNNIKLYNKSKQSRRIHLAIKKIAGSANADLTRHWREDDFLSYCYHSLYITGALYGVHKIFKNEIAEDYHYTLFKTMHGLKFNDKISGMNALRKLEMDIHLQRILLKVDRASMYHSLEVRVPLLSNKMLDLSTKYNYSDCIEGNNGKMNLKRLLIDKTNEQLVMQPKKGFTIPIGKWMRGEIKKEVTEKVMDMPISLSVMFKKSELEKLLNNHMSGTKENGWLIWAIYSLVNWDGAHRNTFKK